MPDANFCIQCGYKIAETVIADNQPSSQASHAYEVSPPAVFQDKAERTANISPGALKAVITCFVVLVVCSIGYYLYVHYDGLFASDSSGPQAVDNGQSGNNFSGFSLSAWLSDFAIRLKMQIRYILPFLIYLFPAIIGLVLALADFNMVNDRTEIFEQWIRNKYYSLSDSQNRFVRIAVRPFLLLLVKFSDWTDHLSRRGAKNGVRVALFI